MEYSRLRKAIANFDDKAFTDHVYAVCNEYGLLAIVYADHAQDALDAAVDCGKMDGNKINDTDHAEYVAEGCEDEIAYLGNAGEPIWITHISVQEIR